MINGCCPKCGEPHTDETHVCAASRQSRSKDLFDLLNKWCGHVVVENFIPEMGAVKWRCTIVDITAEDYNLLTAVRKCDKLVSQMSKQEVDGGVAIESTPLLACPFCGSLDLWFYPDAEAVGCRSCFMTGPIIEGDDRAIDVADQGGDEDAAVMLWNTRHANKS